jgi:K(+)-stimulated pyrophosphate-energized sodium pump
MNQLLLYTSGLAAIVALVFAFKKFGWIMQADAGNERMKGISRMVQEGAAAFLRAEYRWLAVFVGVVALVLGMSSETGLGPKTAAAFAAGAFASALSGFFGMHTATRAAVRTTQAATQSLESALALSFGSGTVMGMCVVGLGLLGLVLFSILYASDGEINEDVLRYVLGFSFGASSIALFARVGGGIFTKAADVGSDLVGKIEAGIPEDDPRNPGTIADNVGDNVGDVAGMGADLFESYVGSIVAAMILGALLGGAHSQALVLLPLAISACGIGGSIAGTFLVKAAVERDLHGALFRGVLVASGIVAASALVLSVLVFNFSDLSINGRALSGMGIFGSIVSGLVMGVAIGKITEYYTAKETRPARYIAKQSNTGPATNIIHGLATGMESVAMPVVFICIAIALSYKFGDVYGIAIAAVGMLSTLGISLAVDAYGPVADNARGLAAMAHLPPDVRTRTESLGSVGNTMAATGKGFAIASAALTALSLFTAFCAAALPGADTLTLQINDPDVMVGLFLGGLLPFLFSALTMRAVGKAANEMVEEIRRQFRDIPGLLAGTGSPDPARCVDISTQGALKQMLLPGGLAIVAPLVVGAWLGLEALGGLIAGALITGVMLAIFMANSGGAWDSAKKFIEDGNEGGKGSAAHKAAVVGDAVGDPFKDTAGPSLNILIKLMTVVGLVFLPWF